MCGICGFSGTHTPQDRETLTRMCNQLIHRGPDSDGNYVGDSVHLGFRRLSIIDVEGGNQPIGNEDGSIQLVFNGEIYSFKTLHRQLVDHGHHFTTRTDTETIVHGYEEYGIDVVKYLRGMYAIALWDSRQQCLYLVRDRFGKKPLYYTITDKAIIFASELKALLQHPDTPREINPNAIDSYLKFGYIGGDSTIYQRVYQLPPAHWLRYDCATHHINVQSYWQIEYLPKSSMSFEEASHELRRIMREAVKLRMISDVPLGALLSGGIDSSIVVGLMADLADQPIRTFSIGFNEKAYNELPYASQVAAQFGTHHTEFIVTPDVNGVLDDLIWYLDAPMADPSILPTYYVCQMARHKVTVALTGDGGDESFAGYRIHRKMLTWERYNRLPTVLRQQWMPSIANSLPQHHNQFHYINRFKRFVATSQNSLAQRYSASQTLFTDETRFGLYTTDFHSQIIQQATDIIPELDPQHAIDWMLGHNMLNHLPSGLLVKADRMSMANSLELRSPFLDHQMVEFVAHLPSEYKLAGNNSKRLLKHAFKDLLHKDIATRKKHGFSVPLDEWMRTNLRDRMRHSLDCLAKRQLFNQPMLSRLFNQHLSGDSQNGRHLWALLVLGLWLERFGG